MNKMHLSKASLTQNTDLWSADNFSQVGQTWFWKVYEVWSRISQHQHSFALHFIRSDWNRRWRRSGQGTWRMWVSAQIKLPASIMPWLIFLKCRLKCASSSSSLIWLAPRQLLQVSMSPKHCMWSLGWTKILIRTVYKACCPCRNGFAKGGRRHSVQLALVQKDTEKLKFAIWKLIKANTSFRYSHSDHSGFGHVKVCLYVKYLNLNTFIDCGGANKFETSVLQNKLPHLTKHLFNIRKK